MYEELVKRLRASVDGRYEKCDGCPYEEDYPCCVDCLDKMHKQAADAIEELSRICDAMKPKHDAVCVKCAYYAESEYNGKGFLICPASGMDITAWDFCSYFEPLPEPPKEET